MKKKAETKAYLALMNLRHKMYKPNGTKAKSMGFNSLKTHMTFRFNKLEYAIGRIVTLNIEYVLPTLRSPG